MSSSALETKALGYFWNDQTQSHPLPVQHTEINLICFPPSQTALRLLGEKQLNSETCRNLPCWPWGQIKDKEILYLWNFFLLSLTSLEALSATGYSHRSQVPSQRVKHLNLKGGSQDTKGTRGCGSEIKPGFPGGGGGGTEVESSLLFKLITKGPVFGSE